MSLSEVEKLLNRESLKAQVRDAFAHVEYPGDWCLRGSNEGDEPYLLEKEFAGKTDWHNIEAPFIDQAPDGYASALSFFSDEAFHFYLPAYLIADIDDQLERTYPAFYLCHGLDDDSKSERVNPLRYGERTWFQVAEHKFAMFNRAEVSAIVAYLQFKRESDEFQRDSVDQALRNYWFDRAGESRA